MVVIANDFSAVNVALPTMEKDFGTNINTIQWVVNAYALTFGVMIVTGGRLADMFGRRNAFFLGSAIFASMSALGGAAQTETWLIVTRTVMGIGGALMWPAILGMTYALLPEDKAGLAGGIIIGAAGLGNAIGPLIGGVLTDALSWRWIFFLNVPISIFAVLVTYRLVKVAEPDAGEQRIDYPGIAAISVGLVSLLVALDQIDDWGFGDPRVLGMFALAAVLLIAFVPIERRAGTHALVPRSGDGERELPRLLPGDPADVGDLLRRPALPAAVHAAPARLLAAAGRGRAAALPRHLRRASPSSPGRSTSGWGRSCWRRWAPPASRWRPSSSRSSPRARATPRWSPAWSCSGLGSAAFYPTATTAGVTSVDESQTSLAGGIVYMFQIAGGSIGLGLTTTVFSSQASFVDGIQAAFRLDAALSFVGFLIALFFVGGRLLRPRPAERRGLSSSRPSAEGSTTCCGSACCGRCHRA